MKEIIFGYFNPAPEEITMFIFPNHIVIAMPDDISVDEFTKENLIKELQSTIKRLEES